MDKLNELVELAKLANIAGQGSPEMVDFRVTANPDTILAIAEAFRELEQENILLKQGCENNPLVHELVDMQERAEAAEAKLAELAKQEPAFLLKVDSRDSEQYQFDIRAKLSDGVHELFTRPAPTAVPVDLVPDEEWFRSHVKSRGMSAMRREGRYVESATRFAHDIWYATQSEMLRRIEELNK